MAVAMVMFVVRPMNIIICSWGLDLSWREKVFLGWVGPRGIVAASMASLFVLSGKIDGVNGDQRFIETFVYSVIIGTIIIQGFSAGWLARLLGLYNPRRNSWIIVGAHSFGRDIARFISTTTSANVILIDTNSTSIAEAQEEGIIRSHGISCHSIGALETTADEPWVEVDLARYNPGEVMMDSDIPTVERVLTRMSKNGKAIIGMKVYGAGRLVNRKDECLEFHNGNDFITGFTLGIESYEQLRDIQKRLPEASVRA
jgi:hypothetical protein